MTDLAALLAAAKKQEQAAYLAAGQMWVDYQAGSQSLWDNLTGYKEGNLIVSNPLKATFNAALRGDIEPLG